LKKKKKDKEDVTTYDEKKQHRITPDHPDEIKIIMVGNSGVGKSSLVLRFTEDFFSEGFISTIGEDFKDRILEINEKEVALHVWDTAGQERFRSLTTLYYRGSQVIVIVFSVTDKKTFEDVKIWYNEAIEKSSAIIFLVGNKTDLVEERVISKEEGENLATYYEMGGYFETSCFTGDNVDETFLRIAQITSTS